MSRTNDSRRVLITGVGVVSAIGSGRDSFWNALARGDSGVIATDHPPGLAAPLRDFEPRRWISGHSFRRMDRLSQMIVAAAQMALADADLRLQHDTRPERVALTVGTALGNASETSEFLARLARKGAALASPLLFPNLVLNASASYAAMEFQVTGPSLTVTEGDVSGELAVALGYDLIASGRADVVLAGGADELTPVVTSAYSDLGLLATEAEGTWPGPFDQDGCGSVLGEGGAVIVLEEAERVQARGGRGLAEIAGYRQWAVPAPVHGWPKCAEEVGAEIRAMLEVLPGTVDAVYTGASGARDRDSIEVEGLNAALDHGSPVWITSIKGATGDFGAAGALAVASAALSITTASIAPLCRLQHPPTLARCRPAGRVAAPVDLRHVLVSGMGRGGNGVGILLQHLTGDQHEG